jgi:hypothetical protein
VHRGRAGDPATRDQQVGAPREPASHRPRRRPGVPPLSPPRSPSQHFLQHRP